MENQKLSTVMEKIAISINKLFSDELWVECEIASISKHAKSGHIYLELVELNNEGNEICKVKASIWKFKAEELTNKFKTFTGSDLSSGMKVLLNVTPSFHTQYHLSFVINDIKPEFTLGGIEAKINMIVKNLKELNEYSKNKLLTSPKDFTNCAVIAPFGAAGLGDFKKEADILQKHNICNFDYYETVFQGKEASNNISDKIKDIVFTENRYDCIIIIRGGGAKTDLHFLNDIKIARYVCRSPIPVFVGIGHERDSGVLDLIANKAFDTPSKVIEYIFSIISSNANEINRNLSLIEERASKQIDNFKNSMNLTFEKIRSKISILITNHINEVDKINNIIIEGTNAKVLQIKNNINSDIKTIEQSSRYIIEKNITNNNFIANEIVNSAINKIKIEQKNVLSNFGLINAYRPSYILDLGFVIIRQNEKILSNTQKLKEGDTIRIESKDTIIDAKIEKNNQKRI